MEGSDCVGSRVTRHGEVISLETRQTISSRYHTVTKAINREFWNSTSDTSHSFYAGSYGRGTAIDTSDVDIIVELPENEYKRFDSLKGNGQSRLLQAVKNAIQSSYPRTDVRADGQVVVLKFSDGMKMEIVPAFRYEYILPYRHVEYLYPDTNNGGNWKSTNPKTEQEAMREKNASSNGLLFDTCKHIRFVRDNHFSSYHLSGIVIDSFVYHHIGNWRWINDESDGAPSEPYAFEKSLLASFNFNRWNNLYTPGSNQMLGKSDYDVLEKVLKYMAVE